MSYKTEEQHHEEDKGICASDTHTLKHAHTHAHAQSMLVALRDGIETRDLLA